MISESKCNSSTNTKTNTSISELIEHYPHLIKFYLSYFLSIAIKNNDFTLLDYLFSIRTKDNTKTFDDFFLQCVQLSKSNMISFCLHKGQYINIQNTSGETALHIAANNNDYETMQFLLSNGADKHIKNNKGLIPYDCSIEHSCKNAIELLKPSKSYSLELNHSLPNSKCYTDRKNNTAPTGLPIDKYIIENMQKSKMDLLISQRTDEYPPEIELHNKESILIKTFEEEFPIEYMKTNNFNAVSNHRYCNENINRTNDNIIDINKYSDICLKNNHDINLNNRVHGYCLGNNHLQTINNNLDETNNNQITETYYNNEKETDDNQHDIRKTIQLALNDNDPFTFQMPKEHILSSLNAIAKTSLEKKSTSETLNNNSVNRTCGDVYLFLAEIQLEEYTEILIKNGFDDIKLIIDQTKKSIAMTDQNLYDAGIRIAGDRAKILIHLEEKAGLYDFYFNKENVYYKHNQLVNSMYRSDRHIQKFYRILSSIKMEKYLNNFISSGYYSFDLLLMQMLSRQPMTEHILEQDIKIDKIGYRARLLTKFKEEAHNHIIKGRNKNILVDSQSNQSEFCNCVLY